MKEIFFSITLIFMSFSQTMLYSGSLAIAAEKQAVSQSQTSQKGSQTLSLGKNQELQAIKPKKPVNIKLHRNTSGQYSWDITGSNPDEVYRADTRLRKLLKIEE
jgi:hypothetical protein